jgi:hypothetical protein
MDTIELLDEYLERWLNIKGNDLDIDAYVNILNFIEFIKYYEQKEFNER